MKVGWGHVWKSRLSYPSNVFAILDGVALLMLFIAYVIGKRDSTKIMKRIARFILLIQAVIIVGLVIFRVDERLLAPLEGRFMPPTYPKHVDGIILLGGSESIGLSKTLKEPVFNEDSQRILKLASLAAEYTSATIVLTGGTPDDNLDFPTEAMVSFMALKTLGVQNLTRVVLEQQSHNTYENVINAFQLVQPTSNQIWIIVTSAMHMPRAMGVFRKYWPSTLLPAPSNWKTCGFSPNIFTSIHFEVGKTIDRVDISVREYLALIFYYVRGHMNEIFPSPLKSIPTSLKHDSL